MSRFAAIEARATQYPASTNDMVWLVARVRQLRDALLGCRISPEIEQCFALACMGDIHRAECHRARAALAALDEPNLPNA